MKEFINKREVVLITLFLVVILMSYGVYLTHPIKDHLFEGYLMIIWISISSIIIPVSLYVHYELHNKLIQKKYTSNIKTKKGLIPKGKESDFAEGIFLLLAEIGDLGIFVVVLIGVIGALFTGVIFAPLLIIVEFLITKAFSQKYLDYTQYGQVPFSVMIANILLILYATYFISIFITTHLSLLNS